MWYYGGMDVPFVDPTLKHIYGLGGFGWTQSIFGSKDVKYTVCDVNCTGNLEKVCITDVDNDGLYEVLPIGTNSLYGTLQPGFTPFVNKPFHPFFKSEYTPFAGLNTFTPSLWGTPYGIDKLGLMKTDLWGLKPWFTTGTYGYSPVEELWKSTLGITTPIYGQTTPFFGQTGLFGTPFYGIHGYTPFGFTGIEERIKFNSPFGFYNTPIDFKVKTFGTPVGMTTDTWNKGIGFPWKTSVLSGPVAVL
jgi:hypothetical protein